MTGLKWRYIRWNTILRDVFLTFCCVTIASLLSSWSLCTCVVCSVDSSSSVFYNLIRNKRSEVGGRQCVKESRTNNVWYIRMVGMTFLTSRFEIFTSSLFAFTAWTSPVSTFKISGIETCKFFLLDPWHQMCIRWVKRDHSPTCYLILGNDDILGFFFLYLSNHRLLSCGVLVRTLELIHMFMQEH